MRPSSQNRIGVVKAEALVSTSAGLPNESNILQDNFLSVLYETPRTTHEQGSLIEGEGSVQLTSLYQQV